MIKYKLYSLLLLLAVGPLCGCGTIEESSGDAPDAMPPAEQMSFRLRGTAYGVLEPISLLLTHDGDHELLDIAEDGPFAFPLALQAGDAYTVEFVGAPNCVIDAGASGVVADTDPMLEVACEGLFLTELVLSGPTAPQLNVQPGTIEYQADVSLLQSYVAITAMPADPEASIAIAGVTVANGEASAPIALNLGETKIEVAVTTSSGGTRTCYLVVHRAVEIVQAAYGKASNTGVNDHFGNRVALSGNTLAVTAVLEDSLATGIDGDQSDNTAENSGAVYVFRRLGESWVQEAYIKASNTDATDEFGSSVALSGDTLAVGAHREDSAATSINGDQRDNNAKQSGAVYVFRRTDTSWVQEAYLKASNAGAGDEFGYSVALSGDTLAVGAPFEDGAAPGTNGDPSTAVASASGAVYVFRRTNAIWVQEAYLKASNAEPADILGNSVALSGDTLAVGARHEGSAATGIDGDQSDNAASKSGAVYVFQRTGTTWTQEAYLKASNTDAGDEFGYSVALAGNTLAVGAWLEDSAATGIDGNQDDNSVADSGAVYVFRRAGTTWTQEGYLKAAKTDLEDQFGNSMSLSGDTLAVGADNTDRESGTVYVFRHIGTTWTQEATLDGVEASARDRLGVSVALSGDTLAVGADLEDSAATGIDGDQNNNSAQHSGAVYIFH